MFAYRKGTVIECGARNMARNMTAIDKSDPLHEAFKRGKELESEMLKEEGGELTGKQFSEKLGITPLELERMRKRNEVFWMEIENE